MTNGSPSPTTPNPGESVTALVAPPDDFGMKPPEGFAPRQGSVILRPRNATRAQLIAAPQAVIEIQTGTNYRDFLGSDGVSASDIATALSNAYGWSMTARNTVAYLAYARVQEAAAWRHAWVLLDAVGPMVTALAKVNIRFATMFSALAHFFAAKSIAGRKAHTTALANRAAGIPPRSKKKAAPAAAAETAAANDNPHVTGGTAPNTPAAHAA